MGLRLITLAVVAISILILSGCGNQPMLPAKDIYVNSLYENGASSETAKAVAVRAPLPPDFTRYDKLGVAIPNPVSGHAVNEQYGSCFIGLNINLLSGPYYTKIDQLDKVTVQGSTNQQYIGLDPRDYYTIKDFNKPGQKLRLPRSTPAWPLSDRIQRKIPGANQSDYFSRTSARIIRPGILKNVDGAQYDFYIIEQVTPELAAAVHFSGILNAGSNEPHPGCSGPTLSRAKQALRRAVDRALAGMKFSVVNKDQAPLLLVGQATVECRGLSRCNWPFLASFSSKQVEDAIKSSTQDPGDVATSPEGQVKIEQASCPQRLNNKLGATIVCTSRAIYYPFGGSPPKRLTVQNQVTNFGDRGGNNSYSLMVEARPQSGN